MSGKFPEVLNRTSLHWVDPESETVPALQSLESNVYAYSDYAPFLTLWGLTVLDHLIAWKGPYL